MRTPNLEAVRRCSDVCFAARVGCRRHDRQVPTVGPLPNLATTQHEDPDTAATRHRDTGSSGDGARRVAELAGRLCNRLTSGSSDYFYSINRGGLVF